MEPANLPPHVVRGCLELARRMDLLLAGIDLRETPDGEYYCFEVNPSPGFLYYEQATGQPISAALADLLHADPARNSTPGTREVLDGRNEVTAGSP
jgi:glutathione synthase/RimK-type ligase-like ATP-grasp enzyme